MHSTTEAAVPSHDSQSLAPADSAAPARPGAPADADPRSWDSLVRRYRRLLAAVALDSARRRGTPLTPEEVEDLIQEMWCRLYRHWGARLGLVGGEGRVYNYLVRTTRNAVRDVLRSRQATKRGGGRRREGGEAWRQAQRRADPRPTPEERAMLRQQRRLFRRRCRRVTDRRGAAIVERVVLEGWTSRELAALLGPPLSPSAIDTLVHRVRRRLAAEGLVLPRRKARRPASPVRTAERPPRLAGSEAGG